MSSAPFPMYSGIISRFSRERYMFGAATALRSATQRVPQGFAHQRDQSARGFGREHPMTEVDPRRGVTFGIDAPRDCSSPPTATLRQHREHGA